MSHKILIIDDEEKLRNLLAKIVAIEGFEVYEAGDCKSGLKKLEQFDIDVVICDVKLPDGKGVDLTKTIKEKYPTLEILLLTAYGNIPDSVQAMKNGAFDYITKGDDNNKIIPLLYKATAKVALTKRVFQLEKQLGNKYSFDSVIGKSKVILQAIDLAKKVATTNTTVLLTGETGTGKEVFAQAIHQASGRSKQNFVALNCSAFSHTLLENEMFGHIADAFTGATKDKKGLFEAANRGTIFLDEIGDMPVDLQAKLLRVLETGELLKVGDTQPTKIDVRIIAATHKNLQKEIEQGNFRQDLFYRIAVFQIKLPSLKDRLVDIPLLANYFIGNFAIKTNKKVNVISPSFFETLQAQNWHGNIRELKNVIERCLILMEGDALHDNHLPPEFYELTITNTTNHVLDLASAEKLHIKKILSHTNGNKTKTAELLNIALTTLYRKIEEYKIS